MVKSAISELHAQNQFKNSRLIAELLCRDDVTNVRRRDLRKLFPEIKNKITNEALAEILKRDVIKGVIFDDNTNEEAKEVKKLIRKLNKPTAKKAKPEPTTKEEPQALPQLTKTDSLPREIVLYFSRGKKTRNN